jgi:hypothetical protein
LPESAVIKTHVPAVIEAFRGDLSRHRAGLQEAAGRVAPGFGVEDKAAREDGLRYALRYLQLPPRGIPEFVVSPMSFLAVLDENGVVIARDLKKKEDDHMRGMELAERFASVKRALSEGRSTEELVSFSEEAAAEKTYTMIFVEPVRREGKVVGAVVAGIPLWRWAQRMSRQGQMELTKEPRAVYWVFAYHGDKNYPPQQGLDLAGAIPNAASRKASLAKSPKGYTGQVNQFGRWYVYGVLPVPSIAPDAGFVIVRAEPIE